MRDITSEAEWILHVRFQVKEIRSRLNTWTKITRKLLILCAFEVKLKNKLKTLKVTSIRMTAILLVSPEGLYSTKKKRANSEQLKMNRT